MYISPLGVLALCTILVIAHDHEEMVAGPYVNNFRNDEPMDATIKVHIALQMSSWTMLSFGMVLGIAKSRWHVPTQVVSIVTTLFASFLAHHHGGRSFHHTAHATLANLLFYYVVIQAGLGTFLRLHIWEASRGRKIAKKAHSIVGKTFPVLGFAQMLLGGITSLGFCFGEHTGQCAAHFGLGSAFILYGVFYMIMMQLGRGWLAKKGISQEMLDSSVLTFFGVLLIFTMHNPLGTGSSRWSHKDMNHVSLGVLFATGGALGVFLSRNGKRSIIPGLIIIMTGYAMRGHAQASEFSTTTHSLFGFVLMSAGASRIIEICFVLKDGPSSAAPRIFQHLPPYLLILSGLIFLSSTEEQMSWVATSGMDSTTYATIGFATSFVIYLVVGAVIETYILASKPIEIIDAESGYEAVPLRSLGANAIGGKGTDARNEEESEETVFNIGAEDEEERSDGSWQDTEKIVGRS